MSMYVIKRNGTSEEVSFDKIYKRIKLMSNEPYELHNINIHTIAQKVIQGLFDGVSTTQIDMHTSKLCASLSIKNYEYGIIAGRIAINNHEKNTLTGFKDKMDKLYLHKDKNNIPCPIISSNFYKYVKKNQKAIEKHIDYNRDYLLDFFSFKTLEKSYLLKIKKTDKYIDLSDNKITEEEFHKVFDIIERPQDLFMRVAIFIHIGDNSKVRKCPHVLQDIFDTYDLISTKYYTHATPTLFNCGAIKAGLASCFLLGSEDNLEGIYKSLSDCASISKWSGGIGLHVSNWRGNGSLIRGTNGYSSGIVPFLKNFNETSKAVNQGGRRKGSFAIYLEPHHTDVMEFLNLRKVNGDEELRARNLFLGMWICDLFMKRVKNNEEWSLFCPDICRGLNDVYGDEYEKLYLEYESKGMATRRIKAREVWKAIYESQKESGLPYICYKDAVNRSNNQSNIGIIRSSNLCTEIMLHSSSTEFGTCNLSSICLPMFVEDSYSEEEDQKRPLNHEFPTNPVFNYEKFEKIVEVNVRNLNKVIDITFYPVPETKLSNMRHRPLGIGVQGLADVFFKFNTTFDSPEAAKLNRYIFETMYYSAVSASTKMSREIYMKTKQECIDNGKVIVFTPACKDGKIAKIEYTDPDSIPTTVGSYPSYLENGGSPLANGQFHWEMSGLTENDLLTSFDWGTLREHIQRFGIRNSMLIALMPTASTSQIMGNIEAFEPLTSNIFTRNTLAGEHIVVNKYLMKDLEMLGLWNERTENWIKMYSGSIQPIEGIPDYIKYKYRTVWEIKQKHLIDLSADRQPFVDQSQSLNLFVEDLTFKKFNSMHFYSWERGLKTGCYYLRSRAAVSAQKFTVDEEMLQRVDNVKYVAPTVVGPSGDTCLVCSS